MLFRQINLQNVSDPGYFKRKFNIPEPEIKNAELVCEISGIGNANELPALFDLLNPARIRNFISDDRRDIFMIASAVKLFYLTNENGMPELISNINNLIKDYLRFDSTTRYLSNVLFSAQKYLVMGILNVTPDSFSDGGKYFEIETAVNRALKLLEDGADIIDVGGESTRPGAEIVSAKEELKRVVPVIEKLIAKRPDALISIDTTKSVVAEAALEAGAKIINDISSFEHDEKMLDVAVEKDAPYILMHMQGTPKNMQNAPKYDDVVSDILEFLRRKTEIAKARGVNNLIIDPGIGFGKTVEDNYEILRRLNEFKALNFPILIGLSRKSFIGKSLNLEVENRDEPTTLLEALSVKNGASIVRTHNVKLANQTRNILSRL